MFSFFNKKSSAKTAKDRLTIAIMSDRQNANSFPNMDAMKAEIIEVVKKYMGVKAIDIKREVNGDMEALSIDVQLEK
ncbi:cell division topological specificity factor MinE [Sulfurimonas sp. SAG-AH-194-L11]|nr:cell division topological specificity factor MinE [Sulfurimonas sp. SAG-AH-194-L11]MDF1877530.1 cell division topological specificity factor MinE [Sulfurimonas sp. SAG-AH-194-L11]